MSTKIEKLTPQQEAKFPVYVDKWIGVGTNTQRITQKNAESIVKDFRELISMKSDVPTFLLENPIECWVACCLVEQKVPLSDLSTEMEGVFNGNPKKWVIPQGSLPFNKVSLVSVFSFYDFMFNEVGVQIDSDLMRKYKIWEKTSELWGIYPLENVTIVCQFPTEIKLNENRVLHCDNGPALSFAGLGDFKVYCLNGVEVPEYLAVTPSHKIDLEMYNKETNADVKAEFVKKVGIERFLDKGKKVDTYENYDQEENTWWWKSEYELWDMQFLFPSLQYAPYLKMRNPTTGVWHVEGVSPNCRNLAEALKERFGGREMRIVQAA